MIKKKTMELVDKETDVILNYTLSDQPYNERTFNKYNELCKNKRNNGQLPV